MVSTPRRRTIRPAGPAWEFLPAMVEIEEALPSPVGRTMAWTIITVFTVTVLWAVFSTVDIIASPVLQAGQESVRER
jgi:hypothetical protein